jgi:hypothetical protein
VLSGAAAIWAAQVTAAGSARAAAVVQLLHAARPAAVGSQPARQALLFVTASATTPLEIDELSKIRETIHPTLLHDNGEMIWGHRDLPLATGDDLQVWLLGYQAWPLYNIASSSLYVFYRSLNAPPGPPTTPVPCRCYVA